MSKSDMNELLDVLRQLVEDTGEVMPGWSILIDAYNYGCSYCGAMATMDVSERQMMRHDKECPVSEGLRLLKKYTHEGGIPQIMTVDILKRWIAALNVAKLKDIYNPGIPNVFYATFWEAPRDGYMTQFRALNVEITPMTGLHEHNSYMLKWSPPPDDEF